MCKSRKRFLTDVAEAREDSAGFIVGKPDNFPLFSAIGGFGPMQDIEKGDCELFFFLFREIIVFYYLSYYLLIIFLTFAVSSIPCYSDDS